MLASSIPLVALLSFMAASLSLPSQVRAAATTTTTTTATDSHGNNVASNCVAAPRHKDLRGHQQQQHELICPPVILTRDEEVVVGAGSNVTLACSARGSPPLTFVWFQDEKNMMGQGQSGGPPPSTKLLDDRRYEIQEETSSNVTTSILFLMDLRTTDTSVFLCWVENAAGSTISNFSLTVHDVPPNQHGTSIMGASLGFDSLNLQVTTVLIASLLILLLTAICLFVLRQVTTDRSSKSSSNSKSDFNKATNHQHQDGDQISTGKFAHPNGGAKMLAAAHNGGQMFHSSDEDAMTDDEDDDHHSSSSASTNQSGSQSSCAKHKTRLLAVKDLDGFFEHMRSGIIDIDHHSMSPAIQFNQTYTLKSQPKNYDQSQLTQLNHFQSASNTSSQQAFYGGQPSNGSNSMATTLSDLSPSSGSASTSFANPALSQQQLQLQLQQQQHYHHHHHHQQQHQHQLHQQQQMMANQHLMRHHQHHATNMMASNNDININNCDYPATKPVANSTGDYQGGYNDDSVAHQIMVITGGNPPLYGTGSETNNQTPAFPVAQMNQRLMYPMGSDQSMVDVMVEHDRLGNPLQQQHQQQQKQLRQPTASYHMQDPPEFSHIL